MRFILLEQSIRHEPADVEPPKPTGMFETHAEANAAMQREYDKVISEDGDNVVDYDDSDASHFYAGGDDVTYHWWILDVEAMSPI